MSSIPILKFQADQPGAAEIELRRQLAAVFRLAVWNDWHEAVANHFSVAVSADGKQFLINPKWKHFSRIRASDLVLLDADDPNTMNREDAPDATAWAIHGRLHAVNPAARCILHVHSPYATALACLAAPQVVPIDQNTARFFNRVAIDFEFGGMADDECEAARIADTLADKTLVLAYSTHQPLKILSDDIAEKTAKQWEQYQESAFAHFAEMRAMLDAAEPDYRD
jgi:ribulose-5-phosphate 4-epimerase/fuculose-1-phosphate aldolase